MPADPYLADLIAKAMTHGAAYQGPATIYLDLSTTAPSASVNGTPPDDANHARLAFDQTTDWDDDDAGTLSSNAKLTWPTAAADFPDDIEAIEAFDADEDGNRLWYELLSAPVTVPKDASFELEAGELVLPVV